VTFIISPVFSFSAALPSTKTLPSISGASAALRPMVKVSPVSSSSVAALSIRTLMVWPTFFAMQSSGGKVAHAAERLRAACLPARAPSPSYG